MSRIAKPEVVLQLGEQVQDLRLDRDVERRDRLVGHDQRAGPGRARPRCRRAGAGRPTARADDGRASDAGRGRRGRAARPTRASRSACVPIAIRVERLARWCGRPSSAGRASRTGPGTPAGPAPERLAARSRRAASTSTPSRTIRPAVGTIRPQDAASERRLARSRLADDGDHLARARPPERRRRPRGPRGARGARPAAPGTASRVLRPQERPTSAAPARSSTTVAHAAPRRRRGRSAGRAPRRGRRSRDSQHAIAVLVGSATSGGTRVALGIAVRAPRREPAARRRIGQVGHPAARSRAASRAPGRRVGLGREERLGVRVPRRAEDLARRSPPRRAGRRTSPPTRSHSWATTPRSWVMSRIAVPRASR